MQIRKHSLVAALTAMLLLSMLMAPFMPVASATEVSTMAERLTQGGGNRIRNEENGKLNYVGFTQGRQIGDQSTALQAISELSADLGLQSTGQLRFVERKTTFAGATVYRFEQVVNGVPVLGGEVVVATDRQGGLRAVSGEVTPNVASFDTTPGVNASLAQDMALGAISQFEGTSALQATTPQLFIYDPALLGDPNGGPRSLVWQVEIKSTAGAAIDYFLLIDAKRGTLRLGFNQIGQGIPTEILQERLGTAEPVKDGPGLPSVPNFNGTATTYNSNSTNNINGAGSSVLVCNTVQPASVNLVPPGACDNSGVGPADERNNAAQFFALQVFDFWDSTFGRNSLDDAGMALISNVDYRPAAVPYNNAFWNGQWMTYGDGDFFTADDIVGHEMGHGITEFTSSLFYYYETGAINESYSDIWGEVLDLLNGVNSTGGADGAAWLMGEDLGIGAIRNMANPPAFGDPDRMTSPNYYAPQGENNGYWDNGGVHWNSGVMNKMFYLVVDGDTFNGYTVSPIGATRNDGLYLASAIWYEAYNYLTSGSDYGVMYGALMTACQNLIGVGLNGTAETISAADCVEVEEAALAVEMDLPPLNNPNYAPYVDLGADYELACPTQGDFPTFLFDENFESGFGSFTTGTAIVDNLPIGAPYWGNGISFYGEPYSWSGTGSLFGTDSFRALDQYTTMTAPVTLTGGGSYFLYFMHSWGFEDYTSPIFPLNGLNDNNAYDGLVLEYTTNGGTTWTDAGSLFYAGRNYNATLAGGTGNPLAGRAAWGYDSHGFVTSMFNLSSLNGQTVNFRWRLTGDQTSPKYFGLTAWDMGYWLDDVFIYSCGEAIVPTDTPTPTDEPGDGGTPGVSDPGISKIGILGPGQLGLPGEQITWVITVTNPTGNALSNVVVSDTFISELRIDNATTTSGTVTIAGQTVTVTIPFLAAGASVEIRVTTTVLRNPAVPYFINTATMTADGGFFRQATAQVPTVSGLPDTGYPPSDN